MDVRKKTIKTISIWYGAVIFVCFVGVWWLTGEYDIYSHCDGETFWFADKQDCDRIFSPWVVRMDAETIDGRVDAHLPPYSFTPGIGHHVFGTDVLGRDVFAGLLFGGQRSLIIGFLSGGLAVLLGWLIGLWSVFVDYTKLSLLYFWTLVIITTFIPLFSGKYQWFLFPFGLILIYLLSRIRRFRNVFPGSSWWWSRGIEWYQAIPDLLLLMLLSASIGVQKIETLIFIIVAVQWPSVAVLIRRLGNEITGTDYFRQALLNRVKPGDLFIHYLWRNTLPYIRGLIPLIIARVILLESTLSFLGLGLPPDKVTIGSMISEARNHLEYWWIIVFGSLFIFVLIYPLQLLHKLSK